MSEKHVIMKHSLAKALMDSGMHHYDLGGFVSNLLGGTSDALTVQNKYQAQLAPQQYTDYSGNIAGSYGQAQAGVGQAQNIQQQQQNLANTLLAQSQGQGPNPAAAQLAQATGANVANQAALMASQRGASSNAGLIARQAAMQGSNAQQQAAGQGATLQAQQQLAAQQALMQQQQNLAGGNLAEQGLQSQLYGQSIGGQDAQNTNQIQNMTQMQTLNQKTAQADADAKQKTNAGILSGIGSMIGGPLSSILQGSGGSAGATALAGGAGDAGGMSSLGSAAMLASKGGRIPIPDHLKHIHDLYHGDSIQAQDFRSGGPVPGKEVVKGDSKKNDVVPAMLSANEVVLPKSVTQAKDAPSKAAEFMRHLKDVKNPGDKDPGYSKVAKSKKSLKDRVAHLEKLCGGGMV